MSEPFFHKSDFDAVARSERFIEAVATGEPVEFGDVADRDTGDRALAALLEDWRDELRAPSGVCPEQDAVAALTRGLAVRRRTRRRMTMVAAMAASISARSKIAASSWRASSPKGERPARRIVSASGASPFRSSEPRRPAAPVSRMRL